MAEDTERTGQCACGTVRYKTMGDPIRVTVCHCKECQRRTGSAFGISCYFPKDNVDLLQGTMKNFERGSDSGRQLTMQFCENCGTTLGWQAEFMPEAIGIAGGTFDDTEWLKPGRHVWASSAQNWLHLPDDVEVLQHGVAASTDNGETNLEEVAVDNPPQEEHPVSPAAPRDRSLEKTLQKLIDDQTLGAETRADMRDYLEQYRADTLEEGDEAYILALEARLVRDRKR